MRQVLRFEPDLGLMLLLILLLSMAWGGVGGLAVAGPGLFTIRRNPSLVAQSMTGSWRPYFPDPGPDSRLHPTRIRRRSARRAGPRPPGGR